MVATLFLRNYFGSFYIEKTPNVHLENNFLDPFSRKDDHDFMKPTSKHSFFSSLLHTTNKSMRNLNEESNKFLEGNYKVITDLILLTPNGNIIKQILDTAIDNCDIVQNLRTSIYEYNFFNLYFF